MRVARALTSAQVRACKTICADECKAMVSGHKTRECSPAWGPSSAAQEEGREIRAPSHLIWNQTCGCCAVPPPLMTGKPMPYPFAHGATCKFFSWATCERFLPRACTPLGAHTGRPGRMCGREGKHFWPRATSVKSLAFVPFARFQSQKPRADLICNRCC